MRPLKNTTRVKGASMVMKKIEGNTQIVFQTVLSGPTFGEIRVQVPNDTEVAYLDHQFLGGEVGREPLEIGTSNSHGLVRYVTINLEKFRTQTTIQIITMRKKIDLHEEVAKAILGQYQKPMWVINEALEFIRGIRPDVMRYGWTVELGGGVLQNGHSNSDLDLVFVSRSDVEPWPVHTILE